LRNQSPVDFDGQYYKLDHAQLSPGNYDNSKPIPIMVGGTGPKRTLRTLARYGDVMDYYKYKAGVLEQHCEECGRDPAEIRRTLTVPCFLTDKASLVEQMVKTYGEGTMAGSRQYIVDRIGEFKDAGIDEIMFGGIASGDVKRLKMYDSEIVSAFR
jgi:alkanesulfonate monooxygenase SsuD/methylene tetrahydromethanopterin reductase-like flavin-dependent oxidoreductase (luciferase family)